MCDQCGCDGNETPCDACSMIESQINKAIAFLRRYRNETPVGHQPHMICGDVDDFLREYENEQTIKDFLESSDTFGGKPPAGMCD